MVGIYKSAYIYTPEFGAGKGGIQTWAYYLSKFFAYYGFSKVSVVSFRESSFFHTFLRLVKFIFSPNGVHVFMTWKMALPFFIVILKCFIFKKNKAIVFIHGNEVINAGFFCVFFIKVLRKLGVRFVVNSHAIDDEFIRSFGFGCDLVVYPFFNAEDLISIASQNEISVSSNSSGKVFLTVTRLVSRKNISSFIKALASSNLCNRDFTYYIAGDGPCRCELETLVKSLSMTDRIHFLGRVSDDERNNLLMMADYFVLPSIYEVDNKSIEGYGIAYIEANCFSVPVISGSSGGIAEAVIDGVTGIHTDGTIDSLRVTLERLGSIDFDFKKMKEHAVMHDFKRQSKLIEYILSDS